MDIVKPSFRFVSVRANLAAGKKGIKHAHHRFPRDAKPFGQFPLANAIARRNYGKDLLSREFCRTALDAAPEEKEAKFGAVGRGVNVKRRGWVTIFAHGRIDIADPIAGALGKAEQTEEAHDFGVAGFARAARDHVVDGDVGLSRIAEEHLPRGGDQKQGGAAEIIGVAKPVDEGFGEGLEDSIAGYFLPILDLIRGGEHGSRPTAYGLEEIEDVAMGEAIDAAQPIVVTAAFPWVLLIIEEEGGVDRGDGVAISEHKDGSVGEQSFPFAFAEHLSAEQEPLVIERGIDFERVPFL